ncbi:hypothetical protein CW304_21620 [Bacillus sp. UFRGS-B20]|nr:hypothetical protein CW304_21620 [Bacillus sp. UFRGS-B20]
MFFILTESLLDFFRDPIPLEFRMFLFKNKGNLTTNWILHRKLQASLNHPTAFLLANLKQIPPCF